MSGLAVLPSLPLLKMRAVADCFSERTMPTLMMGEFFASGSGEPLPRGESERRQYDLLMGDTGTRFVGTVLSMGERILLIDALGSMGDPSAAKLEGEFIGAWELPFVDASGEVSSSCCCCCVCVNAADEMVNEASRSDVPFGVVELELSALMTTTA
jgi:hypothetical protein